ncbi:tetratricopeptide repeat protein [Planctomycetota bacterium]|nr:tetratricopeptide repeat protein [Planctomycetota bacterium]
MMVQKIITIWFLFVILTLCPSCIERPWNKPKPLGKIYARAGKLAADEKYDEALELIEQATKRVIAKKGDDAKLSTFERAMPFYVKGNILFSAKRFDESIKAYDQATQIDSGYAEAWLGGAFVCYQLKLENKAIGYLENAKLAFEERLENVQMWEVDVQITKTYETKLHVAIISGLLGYKDAAISQLKMIQAVHPTLAETDFWIDLIQKDKLRDKLLTLDVPMSQKKDQIQKQIK